MSIIINHHISKISKTANNKLHELARVSYYINEDKRRIIFNSYFLSQFNYCPFNMGESQQINKQKNQ